MSSLYFMSFLCTALICACSCQATLNLIPYPQTVAPGSGQLVLSPSSKIIAANPELKPLAALLSEEIYRASGLRPALSSQSKSGPSILLRFSSALSGEMYKVSIDDSVLVEGGNYNAVAMGTVTLLQLLNTDDPAKLSLPRLTITDAPFAGYRGVMVDVGLRWHPPQTLKPVIDLCRMYKINYLGLHQNNDEIDAMLSGQAEKMSLKEKERRNNSYYTRLEMEEMITYAKTRGVTFIPYIGPVIYPENYPEIFTNFIQGDRLLQDCPQFWQAMDKKISQLSEIYADAPYIHIGAMAGESAWFGANDAQRAFMKKYGIRDSNEYYIWLTERIRKIVKKYGKNCLIWEGVRPCDSKIPLSKDVVICAYSMAYYLPTEAFRDGYSLVNCSWLPFYSVQAQNNFSPSPETVYSWNIGQFQTREPGSPKQQIPPDSPLVKGAQLCIWEETYESVMPDLRLRGPAFSEITWNPDAAKSFENLSLRQTATDARLQRIVYPAQMKVSGETIPGDPFFTNSLTISCNSSVPGTIRYDRADNWSSFPSPDSPVYTSPIVLTNTTAVSVQLFDTNNKPVGAPVQQRFSKIVPLLSYTAYGPAPYSGWLSMPDITKLPVLKKGIFGYMTDDRYAQIARRTFTSPEKYGHVDVRPYDLYNNYALKIKGQIAIPTAGTYTIQIRTSDGMGELYIDGKPIAIRTSIAGPATVYRGNLPAGTFPLIIKYCSSSKKLVDN